jgi:chromosome partitioning protein
MTARTIALAAAKGGVAKSTIASALAVQAMSEGARVALVDAEPQASLGLWWERRGEPDNPGMFTVDDDRGLGRAVAKLRAGPWDYVIVDTPPAMMDRIEAAIRAADVVLIPVRASIFDVEAIAPVAEVCKDYGKTYAFVLSHADPKWKLLPATIDALSDYGPVLAEQLRYNQAYATALTVGKTAAEMSGRVAAEPRAEITALWEAVKKLAAAAVKGR